MDLSYEDLSLLDYHQPALNKLNQHHPSLNSIQSKKTLSLQNTSNATNLTCTSFHYNESLNNNISNKLTANNNVNHTNNSNSNHNLTLNSIQNSLFSNCKNSEFNFNKANCKNLMNKQDFEEFKGKNSLTNKI